MLWVFIQSNCLLAVIIRTNLITIYLLIYQIINCFFDWNFVVWVVAGSFFTLSSPFYQPQHLVKLFIAYNHFITHRVQKVPLKPHQLFLCHLLVHHILHQKLSQTCDRQILIYLVRYQQTSNKQNSDSLRSNHMSWMIQIFQQVNQWDCDQKGLWLEI